MKIPAFLIRQFSSSKKFPMYGFKREVVASDVAESKRWCKKEQNWGKHLYKGKYGNSIYEPENIYKSVIEK
jgi:hypothetical protein